MSPAIATARFIIRNFRPDEEQIYVDLFADPRVNQYLARRSEDDNRKIFRDTMADDSAGAAFSKWAVISKADDDLIGMCLLRSYNNEPGTLEVGYGLHAKYWGQGIATELTQALIDYASGFPDITTIVAVTTTDNIASQIVLQKCGLIKQGNIVRDNIELAFFKLTLR